MQRRTFLTAAAAASAGMVTGVTPAAASLAPATRAAAPTRAELDELLAELIAKHRLPGAVAGWFRGEERALGAAGVANMNTGYEMTPDTGFLTGSITKVWNATLVMTFVDDGLVDLDAPLVTYLPELRFGDAGVTRRLTLRHMLNHSSGLDSGDFILDTGELPEAVARFVAAMKDVGQLHEPGRWASYNNGGWVVAGRVLEVVAGKDWHALLRERVIEPMGLERTVLTAEEAILHRTAVGHVPDPAAPGTHMATPVFLLPKAFAPAGATLMPNIPDQLDFLRMHLEGGVAPNGARILSEASARAMAGRTVDMPVGGAGFGLGWMHEVRDGVTVLSHGGGSNGGRAQAVLVPSARVGFASFANSSVSGGFHAELQDRLIGAFLPAPPPAAVATGDVDPAAFVGTFRRRGFRTTIRRDADGLLLENAAVPEEYEGAEAYGIGQPTTFRVTPLDADTLATAPDPIGGQRGLWHFLEPDASGRFAFMYSAARLARRVAP